MMPNNKLLTLLTTSLLFSMTFSCVANDKVEGEEVGRTLQITKVLPHTTVLISKKRSQRDSSFEEEESLETASKKGRRNPIAYNRFVPGQDNKNIVLIHTLPIDMWVNILNFIDDPAAIQGLSQLPGLKADLNLAAEEVNQQQGYKVWKDWKETMAATTTIMPSALFTLKANTAIAKIIDSMTDGRLSSNVVKTCISFLPKTSELRTRIFPVLKQKEKENALLDQEKITLDVAIKNLTEMEKENKKAHELAVLVSILKDENDQQEAKKVLEEALMVLSVEGAKKTDGNFLFPAKSWQNTKGLRELIKFLIRKNHTDLAKEAINRALGKGFMDPFLLGYPILIQNDFSHAKAMFPESSGAFGMVEIAEQFYFYKFPQDHTVLLQSWDFITGSTMFYEATKKDFLTVLLPKLKASAEDFFKAKKFKEAAVFLDMRLEKLGDAATAHDFSIAANVHTLAQNPVKAAEYLSKKQGIERKHGSKKRFIQKLRVR